MDLPSFRSQFVAKRTYNRPLDEAGTVFETFDQTINRVIDHQRWLWETAKGKLIGEDLEPLSHEELAELEEMRQLLLNREAMVSGRTLWLGGTEISKRFHATQFNCSFSQIRTVHDVVDAYHNLLLGCGVGFEPITGILNGFARPVEIEVIRSTRKDRGNDNNQEKHYKREGRRVWHLIIGDSGIAWAKAAGKLMAMKKPVDIVILDFSEVRPGGKPLRGFGWISSGDEQISIAFRAICDILNRRAEQLLTRMDILDIMNWLGTSLSSRRCLPAGTTVYTKDGPINIEQVTIGTEVITSTGKLEKVTNVFVQGEQHLITIKSQLGNFECTPNHKMAVLTSPTNYEWKMASDLIPGDRLVAPVITYEGIETTFPDIVNVTSDPRSVKYTMPPLDTEMAWFLGYFIGNGTVPNNKGGVRAIGVATPNDESLMNRVKAQLSRFGCNIMMQYPDDTDNSYMMSVHNTNIANYFKKHIKQNGSGGARIPDFIMKSTIDIKSAFVSGIFDADGCFQKPIVAMTTVSSELVNDLIKIYATLGVHVKVNKSIRKEVSWQDIYYVTIVGDYTKSNWYKVVSNYSYKIQKHKQVCQSQNSIGYPSEWILNGEYKRRNWSPKSRQMTVGRYLANNNPFNGLLPIEVFSVVDEDKSALTYDIEVENAHEFIAGPGLLTHNSAEIALIPADDPEAEEFAYAKKDYWKTGNIQRAQSNNSLIFYHKPTKRELRGLFSQMIASGGSEPGFINGSAARKRAPWFRGVNPCAEILLGEKSFCNLVTLNLARFNGREEALHRAAWIMGRANYRQTCVDLRDDILQNTWHELNQFLRLTGVGCAGIVCWEHHKNPSKIALLKSKVHEAVDSMAIEINSPKSRASCCAKPDGTVGKLMDTTEGIHKPLSKYIFNNIIISKASPLLQVAMDAGYRHFEHPFDNTSEIVTLPVCFENVEFNVVEKDGKTLEVNLETAIEQLDRYKMWMDHYADHNVSITVSYSPDEVESIVNWLHANWDHFVGVSFLLRADPTKTAQDLGYAYLPQQPVSKEEYYEYVSTLKPVNLDEVFISSLEALEDDCAGGVCPIR